jgi:hypothetical protein
MAENTLPWIESTQWQDISDEEIRLRCLDYATRNTNFIDPLQIAKDMYDWVKQDSKTASA